MGAMEASSCSQQMVNGFVLAAPSAPPLARDPNHGDHLGSDVVQAAIFSAVHEHLILAAPPCAPQCAGGDAGFR
eukprot:8867526-Pyramimonas_sp.AAC.1